MAETNQVRDRATQEMTDRIPFVKTTNSQPTKTEITVRLIENILKMPETAQRNLLKDLEKVHLKFKNEHPKKKKEPFKNVRKHPRKTSLIAADCSTHDVCFINFIKDISNGGVFIETNAPFYVNQEIKLTFSLPEVKDNIVVGGEVVRVDQHGIGVKFIHGNIAKLDIKE